MARKRGQGEGSIYQRGDGMWVAAISTPSGRKVGYSRTRKGATEKLQKLQRDHGMGGPELHRGITIEELMAEYREHRARDWKPKTAAAAESVIRVHILPHLGAAKVADLQPRQIALWLRKIEATPRTAQYARGFLSSAYDLAMRWQWAQSNPVKLTDTPKHTHRKPGDISPEQVQAILGAVKGTENTSAGTDWHALCCLMVGCGLRVSEALGVRWSDISQSGESQALSISHQLGRDSQGFALVSTKSKSGVRTVAIPGFVSEALEALRQVQQERKVEAGDQWKNEWGLIFTTHTGGPLAYTYVSARIRKALKEASLEPIHLHDLRHAFASFLIDAGVPIPVVSSALGHANPAITMSVYAHKLKGTEQITASVLEGVFGKKETP